MVSTATLDLSPYAAEALSLAEEDELAARAVDLHCRVQVINGKGWTIRVTSWAKDELHNPVHRIEHYKQRGHLADLIHGALGQYAEAFAYSPDELVTIASQSGVAVERA